MAEPCTPSWHVFDTSASAPPLTDGTPCQCGAITFADAPAPLRKALARALPPAPQEDDQ